MHLQEIVLKTKLLSGSNEDYGFFWDCGAHLGEAAVLID